MELIKITETDFENIPDKPQIIYKYRKWDDKYQKTILTDRVVYMAAPTSFEDKKDCKLLKRYDLMTEHDLFNMYLQSSLSENIGWSIIQHKDFAEDWTKKSPLKDKNYTKKKQEEHFQEFDGQFGVLSLTGKCALSEMWVKYSDEGRGFCVGFDSAALFKHLGGGGIVNYYDELPQILHNDSFEVEYCKQIYSKEKKWEFEEEYRTHKFYAKPASISDRQITIPSEAYEEVIFGWQMAEPTRNEIKNVCAKQNLKVTFKENLFQDNDIEIRNFD